jgi:hypothetical protein
MTLQTQRVLTVVDVTYPNKLAPCTSALYRAFCIDHSKISELAVIAHVLGTVLNHRQVDEIMAKSV